MRRLILVLALGCDGVQESAACHNLADYTCMRLFYCDYAEPDYNVCYAKRFEQCAEWPKKKSDACRVAVQEQNCAALHAHVVPDVCK